MQGIINKCNFFLLTNLLRLSLQPNRREKSSRRTRYQLCPQLLAVLGEKDRDHAGVQARVLGNHLILDPTPNPVSCLTPGSEWLTTWSSLVQLPIPCVISNTLCCPPR